MSTPEPDNNYAWGDEIQAVTIALLEGDRLALALDVLRADPASERVVTFRQAEAQHEYDAARMPVQAEVLDGWTLLLEPTGFWASLPENARRLSGAAKGRFVSLYWNVNAVMRFLYAVNGTVERDFDPLVPDFGPHGDPLPEETGLPFGLQDEDPQAAGIALIGRLTGVRLDLAIILETPRPTWTFNSGG